MRIGGREVLAVLIAGTWIEVAPESFEFDDLEHVGYDEDLEEVIRTVEPCFNLALPDRTRLVGPVSSIQAYQLKPWQAPTS